MTGRATHAVVRGHGPVDLFVALSRCVHDALGCAAPVSHLNLGLGLVLAAPVLLAACERTWFRCAVAYPVVAVAVTAALDAAFEVTRMVPLLDG